MAYFSKGYNTNDYKVLSDTESIINFKEISSYKMTLFYSQTITFTNLVNKHIRFEFVNTGTNTVTFTNSIEWEGGSQPVLTEFGSDIYEFIYENGKLYGKRIYNNLKID